MTVDVEDNIVRFIILDISNVYVQIHDQGYCHRDKLSNIQQQFPDTQHWRVVVLD